MEPKELRIGNLVYWNIPQKKNIVHKIDSILPKTYHTKPISLGEHKDYLPIPLTEEWKQKIKDNEDLLIDNSGFVIFKNGYAYQFVFEDYPFIHSFQNLYFALKGQELTIN